MPDRIVALPTGPITPENAKFFIDAIFVANHPITVYKNPDVKSGIVKEYPKGAQIGRIYSWVMRDGHLWWQIDWFSGKFQGWVRHMPGSYDETTAVKTSSQIKHNETLNRQEKEQAEHDQKYGANIVTDVIKGTSDVVKGVGDLATGAGRAVGGLGDTLATIGDNFFLYALIALTIYLIIKYK